MRDSFWSYPVRGIVYLVTHPELYPLVLCPIYLLFLVSITVTGLLFGLALVPQAMVIISWGSPEWLAWLSAVLLVLFEIFLCVWIALQLIFGHYISLLAEKVLSLKKCEFEKEFNCFQECSVDLCHLFFGLILFFVTLPLNGIPILGTACFLALNGWRMCWELHSTHFNKKGVEFSAQLQHMAANSVEYLKVGLVVMALNLIPGIGLLLFFSNQVGIMLLAADMERNKVSFRRTAATDKYWPEDDNWTASLRKSAGGGEESSEDGTSG